MLKGFSIITKTFLSAKCLSFFLATPNRLLFISCCQLYFTYKESGILDIWGNLSCPVLAFSIYEAAFHVLSWHSQYMRQPFMSCPGILDIWGSLSCPVLRRNCRIYLSQTTNRGLFWSGCTRNPTLTRFNSIFTSWYCTKNGI
jgi:hypothetical protein